MKPLTAVMLTIIAGTLLAIPPAVQGQSFSCTFGQPACLDYGDKICSSAGKCVDESATCFDSYTCDYEGFTCKSNLTDLAGDYDQLVNRYNDLLNDAKELGDEYDELLSEFEDAIYAHQSFKDCVEASGSISDARYCF